MRLFVAVPLPADFEAVLQDLKRGLGHRLPNLRWVAPENVHLTLKFLGEVSDEMAGKVRRALGECLKPVPAFHVTAAGLGAFPSPRKPRIVWLGVRQGRETVEALAERVESAMDELEFSREKRSFQAHFTLARARTPRPVKDLSFWKKREMVEVGRFQVDHVRLMQSQLSPEGSIYTVLERYDLMDNTGSH